MRHETGDNVIGVVVAGAVPEATKAILRDHGWGWLDRRGELDLRAPGLVLHTTDIAPSTPQARSGARDPIRGRAGITTAACLLLDPDDPPGVREIARRGNLAPSTVSTALSDLRAASLVEDDGAPLIPELFWSLSGVEAPPARSPKLRVPAADSNWVSTRSMSRLGSRQHGCRRGVVGTRRRSSGATRLLCSERATRAAARTAGRPHGRRARCTVATRQPCSWSASS
jgi:hypothetical protein